MRIADFYTRETANEGKEFDIPAPNGLPSGEKITLRHHSSDLGRAGRAIGNSRHATELDGVTDPVERKRIADDILAEVLAYLVVSWTLEDECTVENATAFFRGATYLLDWADETTSRGESFFPKALARSANTPRHGRTSKNPRAKKAS